MASKQNRAASSDALEKIPRRTYERELARLQQDLVTMQEWVRTSGARVLVVFEGRDAAGKGGTIKRVTRVPEPPCGPDRRAARAERAPGEPVVLPAVRRASAGRRGDRAVRPVLVQPGRRRAGDGLLHARAAPPVPAAVSRCSSGCSSRTASCCASTGSRSATRSRSAGSARGWRTRCGGGSSRRWIWSRSPAGRTTRAPRTRCSCTPTRRVAPWWVVEGERQAPGPAQHDRPPALQRALPGGAASRRSNCRTGHRRRTTSGHRASCSRPFPITPRR